MRNLVIGVAGVITIASGCMVPCGDEGTRIAGRNNSPYCARREAEVRARERQTREVAACMREGGDPVGCRHAIYGTGQNLNVQIGPR
jgi:hypothetical protein